LAAAAVEAELRPERKTLRREAERLARLDLSLEPSKFSAEDEDD
jgi:hypothetical protein